MRFDEPELTSDAGLAAVSASGVGDGLLSSLAGAVRERRRRPIHRIGQVIGQRVYATHQKPAYRERLQLTEQSDQKTPRSEPVWSPS